MTKVRVGVIGAGEFARVCHLPGLQSHAQAQVVALCGRNYAAARAVADQFSVAEVHTEDAELCSRSDIDAVTIATPNRFHAQQAIMALNNGKHVFCEKPLGMTTEEALAMAQVAERSGRVNQVGFTFRYGYALRELRRRVRAGDIGRPFYVRVQYDNWDGLRPDWQVGWREKQELAGGGLLWDLGSHLFDVAQFVLGPVQNVTGFVNRIPRRGFDRRTGMMSDVETDDLAAAWFVLKSGMRGQWFVSRITPRFADKGYLEVIGDKGALKAALSRGTVDTLKVSCPMSPEWTAVKLPPEASDGTPHCLGLMMRSFVDACLRGSIDSEVDASFRDGVDNQKLLAAVMEAHEELKWVTVLPAP